MLTCPILSRYLSGPWSWTECNNDHVLVSDHVDGGILLSGFIFAGFMASKKADLLYFGGPWTDSQCHSETTSNQPHYQFELQLLGPGPCGFNFLAFWISTSSTKFCMTTVKHPDKARM